MRPRLRSILLRAILLGTIALFGSHCVNAQQPLPVPSASGREFWMVFQKNFRDHVVDDRTNASVPAAALELELLLVASTSTAGYVEIPGTGYRHDFKLAPGRVRRLVIDSALQMRASGIVELRGVHVVAEQPLTVYALNRRYQTTETFLVIPVEALGREYRAVGYRHLQNDLISQMAVVATEDNTVVRIAPSVRVKKTMEADSAALARVAVIPDQPIEVRMNRGEVIQLIADYDPKGTSDLTGTAVVATKRVAVFSGHNCGFVPDLTVKACNLLIEQMPPTSSWGRTFAVGAIEGRSWSVVRVVAREDSTLVTLDGKQVASLRAGQHYENVRLHGDALITTSRPALVTQFTPGFDNGDNVGDPMMLVVPPVEQFDNVYTIATPVAGPWLHYINVIARTADIEKLTIDRGPVDQTRFRALGESGLSIGRLEISYGSHTISGAEPFGLYQYGLGYDEAAYDAYGNAAGQLYIDLDAVEEKRGDERELPDIGALTR